MNARRRERLRTGLRWVATVFFPCFGLFHVLRSDAFLPIMPPGIPFPRDVVIATGIAEILGGVGLAIPWTRKAAGIGLALYAVGVFPANIYHAFWHKHVPPLPDSWWYHGPRLAAQPLFVWWALFVGGLVHRGSSDVESRPAVKRPVP